MNSKILKKTAQKAFLLLVLCAFKVHSQDAVQEENPQADVPKQKQVLTVTAPVHSYNLNPHTASYNSEAQILSGIFEGLFSYDPVTLEPQYAIAVSYKISRDSKRWTFTLREDAFFSDGTPVTAESVKKSWLKLLRTPGAPYASLFDIIKGASDFRTGNGIEENVAIYDLDEHTLSIHLTTPASHLPRLLCMASFAVTGTEENVYSGPFVLSEINENQAVLEKNEHYYDKENTKLDRITFRFCDDADENAFAFNTGLSDRKHLEQCGIPSGTPRSRAVGKPPRKHFRSGINARLPYRKLPFRARLLLHRRRRSFFPYENCAPQCRNTRRRNS